jgi:predicted enzyme related to lactoylglutathione lyase
LAGRLIHFEIPAEDVDRAKRFYASLFGWSFGGWDGPVEYYMTEAGGQPGGAVYPRQGSEPGPRIWFDTDDLDAHIDQVRKLGGEATERQPIPGVGWFTLCKDTEGNEFGIMLSDPGAGGGDRDDA